MKVKKIVIVKNPKNDLFLQKSSTTIMFSPKFVMIVTYQPICLEQIILFQHETLFMKSTVIGHDVGFLQ